MAPFSTDRFLEQFLAVQARIYGYIATLVPNHVDADDLFQQTALVLWRKHGQFDPSREFLPWALGIAHNEVRRFFRSHSGRGSHLSDAMMERLAELHYASESKSESRLQQLADCMARLTADQRDLIEQCYLGVDSIKVIAQQQQVEPGTLYKRLDRIRWTLMDCVESAERGEGQP
jgi:RNA polymerase sigma-70 factor (ECF subfamily)